MKVVLFVLVVVILSGCTSEPPKSSNQPINRGDPVSPESGDNSTVFFQEKTISTPYTGHLTIAAGHNQVGYIDLVSTDQHIFKFETMPLTKTITVNLSWPDPKNDLDLFVYSPSCDQSVTGSKGGCYSNEGGNYLAGDTPVTLTISGESARQPGTWTVAIWSKIAVNTDFALVIDVTGVVPGNVSSPDQSNSQ